MPPNRFLILLASPEAAASSWVNKEVATRLDRNDLNTLLIALCEGELAWDEAVGDFSGSAAMPLPTALRGRFADEPFWIDVRPYRDGVSTRDARFVDLAVNFAATVRVPSALLVQIWNDGRTSPVVGASSNELSELRLHDDGADLAAALDLLVGCGGLV